MAAYLRATNADTALGNKSSKRMNSLLQEKPNSGARHSMQTELGLRPLHEFFAGRSSGPAPAPLPIWKRALDLACIFIALPALLPMIVLIVLAIKICSRGPVLFRQERMGLFGRPFLCLKFRTMQAGMETRSHEAHVAKLIQSAAPMTKLDASGDPRIIPMGGFLRASGLDELPQLLNVLRGEMSLIGPRPCLRCEYEKYRPEDRERFNAVPGLTGLWQVSGKNTTTFQKMIELDIAYARHISLRGDLQILLRTFPLLFSQTARFAGRRAFQWKSQDRLTRQPLSQPLCNERSLG